MHGVKIIESLKVPVNKGLNAFRVTGSFGVKFGVMACAVTYVGSWGHRLIYIISLTPDPVTPKATWRIRIIFQTLWPFPALPPRRVLGSQKNRVGVPWRQCSTSHRIFPVSILSGALCRLAWLWSVFSAPVGGLVRKCRI